MRNYGSDYIAFAKLKNCEALPPFPKGGEPLPWQWWWVVPLNVCLLLDRTTVKKPNKTIKQTRNNKTAVWSTSLFERGGPPFY